MMSNNRRALLPILILTLGATLTLPRALAQTALRFEAEDVTGPEDAWQKDQYSEDKWNLWSTDQDAAAKWSEGIVLQSPRVMADRARPEDGAPPLRTFIENIPPGKYAIELSGIGRPMGISLDGENWRKIDGSSRNLGEFDIADGTFELWLDDRYAADAAPGSTYYDYIVLTPIVAGEMGIANGGFEAAVEDAIPGWTWWTRVTGTGAASLTKEQKKSGEGSVLIQHDGERDWAFSNMARLDAEPGTILTASAWVRCEGSDLVEMEITGLAGGEVARWAIGSDTVYGTADWTLLEAGTRVPRGMDQVRVRFVGEGHTRVWIDDVKLREGWPERPDRPVKPPVTGFAEQRLDENLDRGIVALPTEGGGIYVGWRLLKADPDAVSFNVYRRAPGRDAAKLSAAPVTQTTDFVDSDPVAGAENEYFVRPIIAGREGEPSKSAKATPSAEGSTYVSIKLDGDHTFQKVGIADLNGDGAYDYVIKQPNSNVDPYVNYWQPSPSTYKLEAYLNDGTLLWRKDLGWAIEQGVWYSPVVVYDLDGDGKAEVALKAGEAGDPRDADGRVQSGPEWLSILDGMTGEERVRVDWPNRDEYPSYNYASRNQLCVAYLDGKTPCLIVGRGTYNVIIVVAYEYRDGSLRELWRWRDTEEGGMYRGQGAHSMHAVDVDGDGRDEIFLGSAVLDDNGVGLWSTGMGHPDHHYVGDIDPNRPGLEVYYGIEPRQLMDGCLLVDARTGETIWGLDEPTTHVHAKGMCADIDPTHPGSECYSGERDFPEQRWLRAANGDLIGKLDLGTISPMTVYWDADLQREILRGQRIYSYQGGVHETGVEGSWIGQADVLGDWREELIMSVAGELRIYSTTIPARDRRVCLMQDPLYRMDVCIQTMGYTQAPMTTDCLSAGQPYVGVRLPPDQLAPGEETSAEVVAVASSEQPIRGTARLQAGPGVGLSPSQIRLNVPAGEVRQHSISVSIPRAASPLLAGEASKLTMTYEGSGGPLTSEVALRIADLPLTTVSRVQAEDFVEQGGGAVQHREDKVGADGACFSHWDDKGHWLEWSVPVEKAGDYWLALRYCAVDGVERSIQIDGTPLADGPIAFPSTGGFSSDANDWAHAPARNAAGEPIKLSLSAGDHTICLMNTDGVGMNVDYLLLWPAKP
jgi:rhamnogalacturonan endolyase